MVSESRSIDAVEFSDAQIQVMPLHAVTEVVGHKGLVRRFKLEIERFSPGEQAQFNKAYNLAMDLHGKDHRVREPSMNHVLRVTIRIIHHYKIDDVNLIIAALLHDSVEDHTFEMTGSSGGTKDEALAIIGNEFNLDVAELVGTVTNVSRNPKKDRLKEYQEHVAAVLKTNRRARILKISDFIDNGGGAKYLPKDRAIYCAYKYLPLVPIFKQMITKLDTPLLENIRQYILDQIDEVEQYLQGILPSSSD